MMAPRLRVLIILALALGLGGCLTTTPISSLPRLIRLDFLTMDFRHVRAGLRLPATLTLRPGDAVLTIETKTDGVEGKTVDRFALVEDNDAAEHSGLGGLGGEARPGFALTTWRIDPNDVPRLATIQERARMSRISGPRVRGSVAIAVSGGCVHGPISNGPVLVSSYLKPARDETYIPLNRDDDLRQIIGAVAWEKQVPPCRS